MTNSKVVEAETCQMNEYSERKCIKFFMLDEIYSNNFHKIFAAESFDWFYAVFSKRVFQKNYKFVNF